MWLLGCWVEKWLDDKTNMMLRLIPRKDKFHHDQLVMSSSHHIMPSLHHMMMCNVSQSLLDQSFPVSRYLPGKCHTLFIIWSFSIMLYHYFSHTMSYAPTLTHHRTTPFPMTMLSLCLCWFIHSHDPLHFLNDFTNCSHPLSCLFSLLLFYLWFTHLWSSVTATVFILKLY